MKERDSNKVVQYTCDICTLIFLTEDFLNSHKSRAHSNKIQVPALTEQLPPGETNNSCDINDLDCKAKVTLKDLRINVKNIFAGKSKSFIELVIKKCSNLEATRPDDDNDGSKINQAPILEFCVNTAVNEVFIKIYSLFCHPL